MCHARSERNEAHSNSVTTEERQSQVYNQTDERTHDSNVMWIVEGAMLMSMSMLSVAVKSPFHSDLTSLNKRRNNNGMGEGRRKG